MEQKHLIIASTFGIAEEFYLPFKPSVGDRLHIGSLRDVTPDDKYVYDEGMIETMNNSLFVVTKVVIEKWRNGDLEVSLDGHFEKINAE